MNGNHKTVYNSLVSKDLYSKQCLLRISRVTFDLKVSIGKDSQDEKDEIFSLFLTKTGYRLTF